MSRRRTVFRSAALRLWVERMAPVAAVCLLMLSGGLLLSQCPRTEGRNCVDLYARARTAADTALVDGRWANAKARISCGRLRVDGMLPNNSPKGMPGG